MDKRNTGLVYEEMAAKFLVSEGHKILARNFQVKDAEIDIISSKTEDEPPFGVIRYIVFTEVKFRSSAMHGDPYEAVGIQKQKKICKAALKYLYDKKFSQDTAVRFDIISITGNEITHIKNAFEFIR